MNKQHFNFNKKTFYIDNKILTLNKQRFIFYNNQSKLAVHGPNLLLKITQLKVPKLINFVANFSHLIPSFGEHSKKKFNVKQVRDQNLCVTH